MRQYPSLCDLVAELHALAVKKAEELKSRGVRGVLQCEAIDGTVDRTFSTYRYGKERFEVEVLHEDQKNQATVGDIGAGSSPGGDQDGAGRGNREVAVDSKVGKKSKQGRGGGRSRRGS